jgi:hypothetical protein
MGCNYGGSDDITLTHTMASSWKSLQPDSPLSLAHSIDLEKEYPDYKEIKPRLECADVAIYVSRVEITQFKVTVPDGQDYSDILEKLEIIITGYVTSPDGTSETRLFEKKLTGRKDLQVNKILLLEPIMDDGGYSVLKNYLLKDDPSFKMKFTAQANMVVDQFDTSTRIIIFGSTDPKRCDKL